MAWVAFDRGIKAVAPGRQVNVIGRAIESYAKRFGYGVVRDFTGHGVGASFHSGLIIPHYDSAPAFADVMEVGMVFTTVVLVSGPIWAHPVWGIWWTWDARLTSTFILWLLYACFLLLRTLVEEPDRRALFSALFGIFAFIDVPLVFGSIRWWRTQHPQPVVMGGSGSGLDPTMWKVLFFSWFAMLALMALLLRARYLMEAARSQLELVRHQAEAV